MHYFSSIPIVLEAVSILNVNLTSTLEVESIHLKLTSGP